MKQEAPNAQGQAPKLTQWENEPDVRTLQGDLEASRPAHDTFVMKVKKWRDIAEAAGSSKPPKVKGRSSVQPKLVRRQAEWRYSALTEPFNSSEKMFDVKPVSFEDRPAANQNELLLNWQFRTKMDRVSFIDDYIRANVDEGTAIVRLGWCRYTKTVEVDVPVFNHIAITDPSQLQQLQQAIQAKQQDPRSFNDQAPPELKAAVEFFEESQQPTVAIPAGTQKQTVEKIVENRPTMELINPENFFWDPSCGNDLDKAGFIVISFETSQAELKKEPKRYKNLNFVNWEGAASLMYDPNHAPQSTDINFNFKDPLRKRVVAYEYWGPYDIHGTGEMVQIVATWIGDTLIRMEENPFPDKKPPFIVAPYMPVKRQLMGEPDAELLEDNQKILGAVSRGMIDLLGRSANGQQGFAKGMLDVLNRRRYENGQDYEFNPNTDPARGIITHTYPEIPQSALAMVQMQNQEAEALTGVKAFSGGLSGNAYGDVAAGIRGILDAAAKREMSILRRLAGGLTKIGRKIIAMNAVFLSDKEVIRVTNDDFVTINREDLPGEFDLVVDISTAEIDNNKAQDLAFMLQTMGNNMDFNVTKMILIEIARLKRMPDLAKQIQNFQPQPDPLQQQLLQLQIQREAKEIEKLQSDIELNKAKAEQASVAAEQGRIDAVEQETGTKHAREMEKQTAQASGNQDLEVTKALVKPTKEGESKPNVEAAVGWTQLSKAARDPMRTARPDPII
ncbi:MAG: chromosome partitioning protein ParB [Mesorhizobium sp.]|nr:MAG: chromosome partitioning protein ParB [Mesorhizobium sp.]